MGTFIKHIKGNSMSDKKENMVTKQIAEWLEKYDQDRIAYLFAYNRGQTLGASYDSRDLAFACYDGIKGVKDMSLEELIEEFESDFANSLEGIEGDIDDWGEFVEWMNKNLLEK